MSELTQIMLTSAITICGGILVLIAGQWVLRFIIEPIQERSRLIGEITGSLILYANISATATDAELSNLTPPGEGSNIRQKMVFEHQKAEIQKRWDREDEAAEICRKQASELLRITNAIVGYRMWSSLGFLPRLDDVIEASSELIGFSNSFRAGDSRRTERTPKIAKLLKITVLIRKYGDK